MTVLKSGIRELAIKAHEMGAGVLRGPLQRLDEERGWAVGNVHLRDWLARYEGQDVVLIAAVIGKEQEPATKTCGICGREYSGSECPYCREARERLRGGRT
jgi:hypothetical protein